MNTLWLRALLCLTALVYLPVTHAAEDKREWPTNTLPKDYRTPVVSAVPSLFVSGEADGGTPLWYADRVAAGFSNHLQVIVKGQGHTEWSDCLARLYQGMVRGGAVNGLSPSCPEVPRPPFKLT